MSLPYCPGGSKGEALSLPLSMLVLTESWELDIMHRRAGRDARPKVVKHADAHKYCETGRCGTRPGPYASGRAPFDHRGKTAKIIAWRKAKAARNRTYLEENVYGHTK